MRKRKHTAEAGVIFLAQMRAKDMKNNCSLVDLSV
jgi:hypothetical protein